jgi:geranylgeranyl pyrophosphate synthase
MTRYRSLAEKLRACGSVGYARERAQEFFTKAIDSLANLKDSDAKKAMIETAKFIVNRV